MDIKVGDYTIRQRDDGMYNARYLLDQWVERTGNNNTFMSFYLGRKATMELVRGLSESGTTAMATSYERVKGMGRPMKVDWMCPYLFVDFVLWFMSPADYKSVSKVVFERMVLQDGMKTKTELLKGALSGCGGYEEVKLIKWLNYTIVGKSDENVSVADMDGKTLESYDRLLSGLLFMSKVGMIGDFNALGDALKLYHEKG